VKSNLSAGRGSRSSTTRRGKSSGVGGKSGVIPFLGLWCFFTSEYLVRMGTPGFKASKVLVLITLVLLSIS